MALFVGCFMPSKYFEIDEIKFTGEKVRENERRRWLLFCWFELDVSEVLCSDYIACERVQLIHLFTVQWLTV